MKLKILPEYRTEEGHAETSFISSTSVNNTNENNPVPGPSSEISENIHHDTICMSDTSACHVTMPKDDSDDGPDDYTIKEENWEQITRVDLKYHLQNMRRGLEEDMNEKVEALSDKFEATVKRNNEELKSIIQFYTEHEHTN